MEPNPELVLALERDKIDQARAMTPEQRIAAGGELFDDVLERMEAGIRAQIPGATEAQVAAEIRRRLAIAARLENQQ